MSNRILFIYIEKFSGFKSFGINFSDDYNISYVDELLYIERMPNRMRAVLGSNISDINIIGGENGIGKTTLFRKLAAIINFPEDDDVLDDHNFFIVSEVEPGKIKVLNGLSSASRVDGFLVSNDVKLVAGDGNFFPAKTILYYSPFLDFNLLDVGTRDNDFPVIDISQTNTLLQDIEDNNDNLEQLNVLFAHKIKNVTRQVRFVKSGVQTIDLPFTTPQNIDIKFSRLRIENDDVPIMGRSIFEHMQSLCAALFREYPSNNLSQVDFAKLIFLRNLLGLYFHSVNDDKSQAALNSHYPKKLTADIKNENGEDPQRLIGLFLRFFQQENYFKAPIYLALIDVVFTALEDQGTRIQRDRDRDNIQFRVKVSAPLVDKLLAMIDLGKNNKLYHRYTSPNLAKFISLEWSNLSSGEKGFLDIFSRLLAIKPQLPNTKDTILILLDEGEVGFHPSWQMKYIGYLNEFFSKSYPEHNFQLVLATHSPLVLSDLPKERVHLFRRAEAGNGIMREKAPSFGTLAQNVSTLLTQDFFIHNTLIGDLAKAYINNILQRIQELEDFQSQQTINDLIGVIELIDEPIIKKLLLNELNRKRYA